MAAESPTTTTASTGRTGDPARRQRADAQRNVLALLQAATTTAVCMMRFGAYHLSKSAFACDATAMLSAIALSDRPQAEGDKP